VLSPKEETLKRVKEEILNPECHRNYSTCLLFFWQ
jgi:hypothetical protein